MLKINPRFLAIFFCVFFSKNSFAITLAAGQTNFITSGNITTSGVGISSSLVGAISNLNHITNLHTITTGPSSSAYGIRTSGNYNQILNDIGGVIQTTASSGRGISVSNFSIANNLGSITTESSNAYGLYAGGDNNSLSNSGNITTQGTSSYGIYLDGNNNSAQNSGTISTTQTYGIYVSAGSVSAASALNHNVASNSGIINSGNNGIYNKDNFSEITNSGTITSAAISTVYGIRNEGTNAIITNTGNINSNRYAIYNSGDDVIINTSGSLAGGVRMGNATLNILGGNISGEVEGNDVGNVNILANNFMQSADFLNLNSLSIKENSGFIAHHKIESNIIYLGANSNLTFANGLNFSGNILGENDSSGNLNLSRIDFSTNGIGSFTNSLANLNIDLSSFLSSSSDIYVDNISVFGKLDLSNANVVGNILANSFSEINVGKNTKIISGNFSLLENSTLQITLENNRIGNFSIGALSNVDAASHLSLNLSSNNDYIADGTKFTIISAASGSNISAINSENISINGQSSNVYGLLRFNTSSNSQNLFLEANHLAAAEISTKKNVQNIYRNLNKIGDESSGKMRQFQSYIDSANLNSDQLNKTILELAPNSTKASLVSISSLVNNSLKIDERRLEKNRFSRRKNDGFFAQGFGNSINQNEIKDDEGFKTNSVALALGFDHENSGISFSYGRSDIKISDTAKRNLVQTYQLNIFRGQNFDEYFLDYVAGIALHKYDSSRAIKEPSASAAASYFGQSYVAKIKGGIVKELPFELKFIPEISLNFLHNKISGYKERGADTLNLKVGDVNANFLEARIGAAFGIITSIPDVKECEKLLALLKFSYGYNIINDRPTTTASFVGSDVSFNTKISQLDPASLRLGFEVDFLHVDNVNFTFDYTLEKRSAMQSHFLAVKIRQEF